MSSGIIPAYRTAADKFCDHLKSLLPANAWWIVPGEEDGDSIGAYYFSNATNPAEDNSVNVHFTVEMMAANGITAYKDDYVKAAEESVVYLDGLIANAKLNPKFDLLRILMTAIAAERPEWDLRFRKESDPIDDWFTINFEADGVPFRSGFHAFNYSPFIPVYTPRWETLEVRPVEWYEKTALEVIRIVEKDARREAKAKAGTSGLRSLFGR